MWVTFLAAQRLELYIFIFKKTCRNGPNKYFGISILCMGSRDMPKYPNYSQILGLQMTQLLRGGDYFYQGLENLSVHAISDFFFFYKIMMLWIGSTRGWVPMIKLCQGREIMLGFSSGELYRFFLGNRFSFLPLQAYTLFYTNRFP